MRLISLIPTAAAVFAVAAIGGFRAAPAEAANRISGPHVHDNLAVYFIHGPSTPGPVPLTLAEAMAKGHVNVIETGSVNELKIENLGLEEVFIQSGDIVKGGKQDRVLTISLLLPAKSGQVPIASFCVEQGRWTSRGKEDVAKFASSAESLPSRAAKLAMRAPALPSEPPAAGVGTAQVRARPAPSDTGDRQQKVWREVANTQAMLSAGLGAKVAAPQSATSLQLALENEKLKEARAGYLKALEAKAKDQDDVVGYVFAVNGQVNSGDVYPSHALFTKMWSKLLNASVTEAIGEKSRVSADAKPKPTPVVADVEAFLVAAESGKADERPIASLMKQETRDADKSLYVEAKRADGRWVHRNYLAK